jgi:hypothetical protein
VANQRADFLHKTSRRVVDSHQGFAFEELRIKNMLKNHRVAKAISGGIVKSCGSASPVTRLPSLRFPQPVPRF